MPMHFICCLKYYEQNVKINKSAFKILCAILTASRFSYFILVGLIQRVKMSATYDIPGTDMNNTI